MMITIQGLAPTTKYADVKKMIKQECSIDDFILDNLLNEPDGTKKVRIGLTDENEGVKLMKCLDGYRMPGNYIIKVSPVGKPVPSGPPGGYNARSGYQDQQRNEYTNQPRIDYNTQINSTDYNRGPHGPNVPRGPGGLQGPGGLHVPGGPNKPYGSNGPHFQGPSDNMRPSPWTSNSNTSNQWGPNPSMSSQIPQNTFSHGSGPQQQTALSGYMPQHSVPRPEVRPYDQVRQGPPLEQSYGGYPPKQNIPPRRNLRSIDTRDDGIDAPSSIPEHGGRYPPNQYQPDKPVTIMKDNFQGPTPFNINHPSGPQQQPYQQRTPNPSWQPPLHQQKPDFLKTSPLPFNKSFEDPKYGQGDPPRDPKNFQSKPDTYKEYEKLRGFSPSRDPIPRRISPGRREDVHRDPTGRREGLLRDPSGRREELLRDTSGRREELLRDPSGRREELLRDPSGRREELHRGSVSKMGDMGPGGRMDPTHRRVSPQSRREDPHGRRYSPSGKRISPAGDRRNIPGSAGPRHDSPPRRMSPSRRLVSPGRRDDRQIPRYSPARHHSDKMGDKFGPDSKDLKKIRPAYEPSSHAPNQAIYSGGFRPGIHDTVQYPVSGMREEQSGPWQRHIDDSTAPMKKQEDERRMQMIRDRGTDKGDKRYSPTRKSRSPNRRDRSPLRDRFKRNSVSPRSSYSPRRSWALEKRRSPDAPPPPVWPGQNPNRDLGRPNRSNFPEKDEKPKHQPVWEGRSFKEEELRNRRPEDRRNYEEAKLRVAKELMERESTQTGPNERYQPKFSPRDDYEERRDNYRPRDLPDRKAQPDDFGLSRRPRQEDRHDDYNRRRESPHRDNKMESSKDFDKDFEDIYNRAMQFKKKAEELRKSGSRKRDDFDDNRRHGEKMTGDMRPHYEDHGRHREEESLRQRDDRSRDDRPRHDGAHRDDYRMRDSQQMERDRRTESTVSSSIRQKREKAIDEIAQKILDKNEEHKHIEGEQRRYIIGELKTIVGNLVYDMFGDSDVSFIEVIIKYQAKYNLKDEAKILQDVMRSLPKQFRSMKRHAPESLDVPAKISRGSPSADLNEGRKPALLLMKSNHPHLIAKRKQEAWPAQRPGRPDQITKPVQRPGRPDPMGRPVQRPFRPDPMGRPVQREVREPITKAVRQRPAKLERQLQAKASQRELKPELVPKPIKKAVKREPMTKPPQRAVKPESMTKAPQRKVQPAPVAPQEVKTAPVAKREVKPVAKTVTSAEKVIEVKAPETPKNPEPVAKKVVKSQPAAEKARSGDFELNAFMTRMLDDELQNLMDRVLQDLANNASMEDIESGVAGMLQSQVGPDLRDVLGLNVTKRLLNVYNPLNVKVKFNGKPEKEELREFLKKYNFIGFVREAVNIFAAQVKGIDDFDKLCKEKEVKCGNVKVTINPVYSFTTCPPNLITKYEDINLNGINTDIDKNTEINDSDNKNTAETSKGVDYSSTVQVKIEKTTPVKDNEANKAIEPNKPVLNTAVKVIAMETDPPVVVKTENNNVTPTKAQTTVTAPAKQTSVKTETKVTPVKTETKVAPVNTEAKVNPTKILVTPEKATNKVAQNRVLTTPTKPAAKVTPAKITQTVAKVTPTKSISTKAAPTKAAPTKLAPAKVAPTKVAPTKVAPTKVAPTKSAQTKVAPTKFAPTKATPRKSKEPVEEDDYDELDDHDILALMSEGIVLDEYVGSEEE